MIGCKRKINIFGDIKKATFNYLQISKHSPSKNTQKQFAYHKVAGKISTPPCLLYKKGKISLTASARTTLSLDMKAENGEY